MVDLMVAAPELNSTAHDLDQWSSAMDAKTRPLFVWPSPFTVAGTVLVAITLASLLTFSAVQIHKYASRKFATLISKRTQDLLRPAIEELESSMQKEISQMRMDLDEKLSDMSAHTTTLSNDHTTTRSNVEEMRAELLGRINSLSNDHTSTTSKVREMRTELLGCINGLSNNLTTIESVVEEKQTKLFDHFIGLCNNHATKCCSIQNKLSDLSGRIVKAIDTGAVADAKIEGKLSDMSDRITEVTDNGAAARSEIEERLNSASDLISRLSIDHTIIKSEIKKKRAESFDDFTSFCSDQASTQSDLECKLSDLSDRVTEATKDSANVHAEFEVKLSDMSGRITAGTKNSASNHSKVEFKLSAMSTRITELSKDHANTHTNFDQGLDVMKQASTRLQLDISQVIAKIEAFRLKLGQTSDRIVDLSGDCAAINSNLDQRFAIIQQAFDERMENLTNMDITTQQGIADLREDLDDVERATRNRTRRLHRGANQLRANLSRVQELQETCEIAAEEDRSYAEGCYSHFDKKIAEHELRQDALATNAARQDGQIELLRRMASGMLPKAASTRLR